MFSIAEFEQQYGEKKQAEMKAAGHGQQRLQQTSDIYTQGMTEIEAYLDAEPVPQPPFDDSLSKQEMIEHLVRVHGLNNVRGVAMSINGGTKATKEQMIRLHDGIHASLNDPSVEFRHTGNRYDGTKYVHAFAVGNMLLPLARHDHAVPVVAEIDVARVEAIRNNEPVSEKPLSVQERKVLTELVNNDFSGLKSEMRAFAADQLAHVKAEIEQTRVERVAAAAALVKKANRIKSDHKDKVRRLEEKHKEEMRLLRERQAVVWDEIIEEAHAAEVVFGKEVQPYFEEKNGQRVEKTREVLTAVPLGIEEALAKAEADNKGYLARAEMTLERQRLDAQRRVLVSGVTKEAAGLLDTIPDAKSMMVEAAAHQPKAINA